MNNQTVESALSKAVPAGSGINKCDLVSMVIVFLEGLKSGANWWQKMAIGAVVGAVEKWQTVNCS